MERFRQKFKIYKNGFTLAEVLITLVIVGVVAALTIPTLINKTQKHEIVAGVKKAYSTLLQAQMNMARNNDAAVGDYSFLKDINFIDEFAKVTNVVQKEDGIAGCLGSNYTSEYKWLNGGANGLISMGDVSKAHCCIMSDGMIYVHSSLLNNHGQTSEDAENIIGSVFVDVNGKKGPNVWGRDLFIFDVLSTKGILPGGYSTGDCNNSSTGYNCTAKVLRENAMNY